MMQMPDYVFNRTGDAAHRFLMAHGPRQLKQRYVLS
jgi:hypothetical protein